MDILKNIIKCINPFTNYKADNKILYTVKYLLRTYLIYFIGLLIAEGIIMALHFPLGYNPMGNLMPFNMMYLCQLFGYIVPILLFILVVKKLEKGKLKDIGCDKNFKSLFKGLIIGISTLVIIIVFLILINQVKFIGFNNNVDYLMIILFFFAYLVQSSMEEIICRGYLLNKLKEKLSVPLSVFIGFMLFSVLHFSKLFASGIGLGIIGTLNLFLISMIWSCLVLKEKNIYSAIGYHFIWNFALYNIIGLNVSGVESNVALFKFTSNENFLIGGSYGIEASIITLIILLISLILVGRNIKLYKK